MSSTPVTTPATLDQHLEVLVAARESLAALGSALYQAGGDRLGELLRQVDALAAAAGGVRCEIVLDARRRGEIAEAGQTTREWVFEYAPSQRQAGHAQLAGLVDTVVSRTSLGVGQADHDIFTNADSPIAMIWRRVTIGEVAPPLALGALNEMDRLKDRLVPDAVPTVTTALLDVGVRFGRPSMSELRVRLLATYGQPDEVENEQRRLRSHAFLSGPQVESGDLTKYTMGLTPEQAAILEAAIGPLAKPQPNPRTGERDLRSTGQRRAQALAEICSQASSADADRGAPGESDACVYVTVALETLRQHAGAGEVLGSAATGTLLGAETLRKMCCDAAVIPAVLGAASEQLDYGRVERLFTRRQRRAIWRRDRSCTYPGCGAPAAWTRVHHVHHWADGGPSDIDNAALLCQRHHTYVHDKRLWAEVRGTPDDGGRYVHWDLTPGSYDVYLARRPERSPWTAA
jgi:hypothetical protein